jgi:hypothetical protein
VTTFSQSEHLSPFSTRRICSRKAKTKIQQRDWLVKKFVAKKQEALLLFTANFRFTRANSPTEKRTSILGVLIWRWVASKCDCWATEMRYLGLVISLVAAALSLFWSRGTATVIYRSEGAIVTHPFDIPFGANSTFCRVFPHKCYESIARRKVVDWFKYYMKLEMRETIFFLRMQWNWQSWSNMWVPALWNIFILPKIRNIISWNLTHDYRYAQDCLGFFFELPEKLKTPARFGRRSFFES